MNSLDSILPAFASQSPLVSLNVEEVLGKILVWAVEMDLVKEVAIHKAFVSIQTPGLSKLFAIEISAGDREDWFWFRS